MNGVIFPSNASLLTGLNPYRVRQAFLAGAIRVFRSRGRTLLHRGEVERVAAAHEEGPRAGEDPWALN